jgi:uncharacterized protein YecE (DUF72 family)
VRGGIMMISDYHTTHVGMGGWDLEPFHRLFYPPRPKKGFRKLEYYSQFFDSVEVNSTFYNTSLNADHARRWLDDVAVNKRFVFTVKLYRGFTHTFDATKQDVRAVKTLLEPLALAEKLGGLVIQFPSSFANTRERRLYLMQLGKVFQPYRLFVEVRHNSWNSPLMWNFFQENKMHLVNVDLPPLKNHMPLTALAWDGAAYFRMMGRNTENWYNSERGDRYHYLYSQSELERLLSLIEHVRIASHSTFVVFHNDPEANSLVNGFQVRHMIRQRQPVLVPQNLIRAFPALKEISASVNVSHPLFAEVETEAVGS